MDLFSIAGRVALEGVDTVESGLRRVDDRAASVDLDAEGRVSADVGDAVSGYDRAESAADGADLDASGDVSISGVRAATQRLGELAEQTARNYDAEGEVRVTGFRAVGRRIGELRDQMQGLGDRAGRLGQRLSTAITKPVATGAAGAAASLGGLTYQQARQGKETQVMAERLGISAEAMQELMYAGQRYGAEQDAVIDGLKELQLRASEFASTGEGPAKDMFEALGLSQGEISRLSKDTEALFNTVQQEIAGVQNQAEKQRMADELFGGQGGEQLITMLGSAQSEIQGLRNEAQQVGAVVPEGQLDTLTRMSDGLDRLMGTVSGAAAAISSRAAPAFNELVDSFREWITANEEALGEAASGFFGWIQETGAPLLETFLGTIGAVAEAFGSLPGPLQQAVAVLVALGTALGPILSVLSAILVPLAAGTVAFSGLAGAIGTFLAVAAPVVAAAMLMYAAIEALVAIVLNWDEITKALANTWEGLKDTIADVASTIWETVKEWGANVIELFKNLPGNIAEAFENLRDRTAELISSWVDEMKEAIVDFVLWLPRKIQEGVDKAVSAFGDLYNKVVGNSIVPDMVEGVKREVGDMADATAGMTNDMTADVQGASARVTADDSRGGSRGGDTRIDMRHAIIRDEDDLVRRARRGGAELGAW